MYNECVEIINKKGNQMKVYTENEISTAVDLAVDSQRVANEVISILHRINEDKKFANNYNLNQSLHLKNVLLNRGD